MRRDRNIKIVIRPKWAIIGKNYRIILKNPIITENEVIGVSGKRYKPDKLKIITFDNNDFEGTIYELFEKVNDNDLDLYIDKG